jgi:hypothetical protein
LAAAVVAVAHHPLEQAPMVLLADLFHPVYSLTALAALAVSPAGAAAAAVERFAPA